MISRIIIEVISTSFIKGLIYKIFAHKFVAGETLVDAKKVASELQKEGFIPIFNLLGEEAVNTGQALDFVNDLIETIKSLPSKSRISIKPSQIGLKINDKLYFKNLSKIGNWCMQFNMELEIDIEDHNSIYKTIYATMKLKDNFPKLKLRQAVQARLERTSRDIAHLEKKDIKIRLCKGAYHATKSSSSSKKDILKLFLLSSLANSSTHYIDFATHDKKIIKNLNGPFQFLLGFKKRLAKKLIKEGRQVAIYIPFGPDWEPYGVRRLYYVLGHLPGILWDDFLMFWGKRR